MESMPADKKPFISVLIPTLNAAKVLEGCLKSIDCQNYPRRKFEIIIADGGSTDRTLAIGKKYHARIFKNPLKTGESGKMVALRHARGELVALIDSDNILPDQDWFKKMVLPFTDLQILGSEPWEFTYRKKDPLITRYCALLGANDPYCFFVGNYDKKSVLSGKWTGLKIQSLKLRIRNRKIAKTSKKEWDFLKIKLENRILPTIGANGTVWRRDVLKRIAGGSHYLFDTDIPYLLAKEKPFYFAKVKTGIIHLYCQNFSDFYRKQTRRVKDFYYLEAKKQRQGTYQRQLTKQIYFIFSAVLVLPLVGQAVKGYLRKPDIAWFFHPWFCLATLWIYSTETFFSFFNKSQMARENWHQ
ncbi:MAG: glycosyltransferase family 2 protein [Candidatus Pacebacteria bacterium]|nr:glycosyltransferase family 2 protein [Candidatus Paceibacterota bacterium]